MEHIYNTNTEFPKLFNFPIRFAQCGRELPVICGKNCDAEQGLQVTIDVKKIACDLTK